MIVTTQCGKGGNCCGMIVGNGSKDPLGVMHGRHCVIAIIKIGNPKCRDPSVTITSTPSGTLGIRLASRSASLPYVITNNRCHVTSSGGMFDLCKGANIAASTANISVYAMCSDHNVRPILALPSSYG